MNTSEILPELCLGKTHLIGNLQLLLQPPTLLRCSYGAGLYQYNLYLSHGVFGCCSLYVCVCLGFIPDSFVCLFPYASPSLCLYFVIVIIAVIYYAAAVCCSPSYRPYMYTLHAIASSLSWWICIGIRVYVCVCLSVYMYDSYAYIIIRHYARA